MVAWWPACACYACAPVHGQPATAECEMSTARASSCLAARISNKQTTRAQLGALCSRANFMVQLVSSYRLVPVSRIVRLDFSHDNGQLSARHGHRTAAHNEANEVRQNDTDDELTSAHNSFIALEKSASRSIARPVVGRGLQQSP